MANVVILGLPQAMAKIAAIPTVAEVSGQAGLTAGKLVVAADARARAPRRTGALASSIVPVPEGVAVVQPYAGFVEFGTRYMEAQPYLTEALEDQSDRVSDLVANAVRTALFAL